ncbi:MAG: hypothetical protein V9H26_05005 [Verrucomicrobiota bacterium]
MKLDFNRIVVGWITASIRASSSISIPSDRRGERRKIIPRIQNVINSFADCISGKIVVRSLFTVPHRNGFTIAVDQREILLRYGLGVGAFRRAGIRIGPDQNVEWAAEFVTIEIPQ